MADEYVRGLKELDAFMQKLPAKMEANVAKGALRAGMNAIKPIAVSKIRSRTRWLAKGLKVVGKKSPKGKVIVALKATGKHAFIAKFLEYGTRPHLISVSKDERGGRFTRRGMFKEWSMTTINRGERALGLKIGGRFVGPVVKHPGIGRGRFSFMRPALDQGARAATIAAAEYIKKRLATKHGLNTADVILPEG